MSRNRGRNENQLPFRIHTHRSFPPSPTKTRREYFFSRPSEKPTTYHHYLQAQGRQTFLILVTSGLAIFPGPQVPNYSASKAAVHSLALSLRAQLYGTGVNVLEIIPP
jgi:NAD(P)-dependent dehydrogenase (short-subunit alcohol dehydrogenase family)